MAFDLSKIIKQQLTEAKEKKFSAKEHYKQMMADYKAKHYAPPIDHDRFPNREKEGLEGPFRHRKTGVHYYYDKKEGKYYHPESDMYHPDVTSMTESLAGKDQKEEGLKRTIKGFKAHLDRVQMNLDAHKDRKKEEAMAKLFKEDNLMERDEKVLGRYRIIHNATGDVMGSHDDKTQALALGKKCGGFPHVRMEDTEKAK